MSNATKTGNDVRDAVVHELHRLANTLAAAAVDVNEYELLPVTPAARLLVHLDDARVRLAAAVELVVHAAEAARG